MREQRGNSRNRCKSKLSGSGKGGISTQWRKGGCSITGLPGLRQVPDPRPTAVTAVGLCSEAGTSVSCPLSALAGTWGEGATGVWWGLVGATQAAAE